MPKKEQNPQQHNSLKAIIAPLLLLWGIVFINLNVRTIFGVLGQTLSTSFNVPVHVIIELGSFIAIGTIISMILSPYASYYFMHNPTLQLSLVLIALGLFMAGISTSIEFIRIAFITIGLGAGLYPGSGITVANNISTDRIRGRVMAIHESGPVGAFIFLPLFSGIVLVNTNWRVLFFVYSSLCIILLLMVKFWCNVGYFRGSRLNITNIKKLIKAPAFWCITLAFSYVGTTNIIVYTSLSNYLILYQNQTEQTVSIILSLSRVSGLFTIFFSGIVMSRVNPEIVILYTGIISGVLTALLGIVNGVSLLLVVFLQTFAISGFFPAIFVTLGKFFPGRFQNLVVTIMSIISQIFGITFPLLASTFARHEKMQLFFILLGCFMIPMVSITLFLRFTKPTIDEETNNN